LKREEIREEVVELKKRSINAREGCFVGFGGIAGVPWRRI